MMMLFYSPGACSLAPHIALEECGAKFEAVRISVRNNEHETPAFRKINPKARVPALVTDDWVLTEVPAILLYIAKLFPRSGLYPVDPKLQARADEWLCWISSTIHMSLAPLRRPDRFAQSEPARSDVASLARTGCIELWMEVERKLANPWALGEHYSIVDSYLLVYWRAGVELLKLDMNRDFPHWTAHTRQMLARPAVRATLARENLELQL